MRSHSAMPRLMPRGGSWPSTVGQLPSAATSDSGPIALAPLTLPVDHHDVSARNMAKSAEQPASANASAPIAPSQAARRGRNAFTSAIARRKGTVRCRFVFRRQGYRKTAPPQLNTGPPSWREQGGCGASARLSFSLPTSALILLPISRVEAAAFSLLPLTTGRSQGVLVLTVEQHDQALVA